MLVCPALRIALVSHLVLEKFPLKTKQTVISRIEGLYQLSTGPQLEIFPSVVNFDGKEWNAVVPPEKFFMQHDFLRAFESSAPSNLKFHYAVIREKGKAIAVFCFQVIRLTADEIGAILKPVSDEFKTPKITEQWGEWLQRRKKDSGMRVLINGNNFISGEYGVAVADGVDKNRVYLALAETVKLITRNDLDPAKISSILVKDHFSNGRDRVEADALLQKRYHRFRVEPEMIVDIDPSWMTFDDYLGAMSKKYRKRAKDVFKASDGLIVKEVSADELQADKELLHRLYLNLSDKAKFKLSALTPEYFPEMKRKFPDIFRVFVYEREGTIVAFRSTFTTSSHLEAHYIGMDYELNRELHIYQRILYDFISQSIASGQSKLYLGRTASEMKTTVGAKPVDLVCYIRHRNGFSNQVIRPFIDFLQPSVWTPRNPFKGDQHA